MSTEVQGEWKLLRLWECRKCKALIRLGRDISKHRCGIDENELIICKNSMEEQKKTIDSQKITIEEQNKNIENKDKFLKELNTNIDNKDKFLKELNTNIDKKDKIILQHQKELDEQKNIVEIQKKSIEGRDKILEEQSKSIENIKKTIEIHKKMVENKDKILEEKSKVVEDNIKLIEEQNKIIDDQQKTIKKLSPESDEIDIDVGEEIDKYDIEDDNIIKFSDKNTSKGDNGNKEKIYVDIWKTGYTIKDSKDVGYREDIEVEIFEKGKGKKRIIIKNGKVIKKPEDINIIGEYNPQGFIVKGIYKN